MALPSPAAVSSSGRSLSSRVYIGAVGLAEPPVCCLVLLSLILGIGFIGFNSITRGTDSMSNKDFNYPLALF